MSETACRVPAHGAGDLRTADPRPIGHIGFGDGEPSPVGSQDHLERPARAPVGEGEPDEGVSRTPHAWVRGRAAPSRCAAAPRRRGRGWPVAHGRARRRGRPRAEDKVGLAHDDRPGHLGKMAGSRDPSQSMKQTMSVALAMSPAQQAAPNPRTGSVITTGSESLRAVRRAVGGPVVDHERRIAVRHPRQHPRQRLGLVEDGQDHIGHPGTVLTGRGNAKALKRLRIA